VTAGALNITATATPDAIATAKMVQITAVGGFDASPRAVVGGLTESYIGDNETVDLGSGAATLTATRTANAKTEAARTSVSLIEVAFVDLVTTIDGTIAAHIDDRADVTAGSVTLSAGGTSTPVATTQALGVKLVGASGSSAKASDTTTVTRTSARGTPGRRYDRSDERHHVRHRPLQTANLTSIRSPPPRRRASARLRRCCDRDRDGVDADAAVVPRRQGDRHANGTAMSVRGRDDRPRSRTRPGSAFRWRRTSLTRPPPP
jgi:hypothetical protein